MVGRDRQALHPLQTAALLKLYLVALKHTFRVVFVSSVLCSDCVKRNTFHECRLPLPECVRTLDVDS